jgi:tellurite resistance protein
VAPPLLTPAEAYLRVALLVSRADGHESPEEMVATASALGRRLGSPSVDTMQVWKASTDVTTTPARDLIRLVRKSLPARQDRVHAFAVACEVAKADNRLRWDETKLMVEVAKGLGLTGAEVETVASSHWN